MHAVTLPASKVVACWGEVRQDDLPAICYREGESETNVFPEHHIVVRSHELELWLCFQRVSENVVAHDQCARFGQHNLKFLSRLGSNCRPNKTAIARRNHDSLSRSTGPR